MAEVFCGQESCGDTLFAGEMALSSLYGAQTGEGLDALRYRRFFEKVSKSKTTVQLQSMPPTQAVLGLPRVIPHRSCVFASGAVDGEKETNAEEWGWLRLRKRLEPRITDLSTRCSAEGRQV